MKKWVRQFHRWVSMLFVAVVVVVTVLSAGGEAPAEWVYLLPLLPLALLSLSGLSLFVLPYLGRAQKSSVER